MCILLIKGVGNFRSFVKIWGAGTNTKQWHINLKGFLYHWNRTFFLLSLWSDTLKDASWRSNFIIKSPFLVIPIPVWGRPSWIDDMKETNSMISNLLLVDTAHLSFLSEKNCRQYGSCNDMCKLLLLSSAIPEFLVPLALWHINVFLDPVLNWLW